MAYPGQFSAFAVESCLPVELHIDATGTPLRQRRSHRKTKSGCITCKIRKVKCDETRPVCLNCSKREVLCRFESFRTTSSYQLKSGNAGSTDRGGQGGTQARNQKSATVSSTSASATVLCDELNESYLRLDMSALNLLHHFEAFTSKTLLFDEKLWQVEIMPLALKNEYLMHAILLLASAHLAYLHPTQRDYLVVEAQHLSSALGGFRTALASPIIDTNADSLLACSLLLLQHAWSQPSFHQDVVSFAHIDIGADSLFDLSAGLRSVLHATWHVRTGSIFNKLIISLSSQPLKDWKPPASSSVDFRHMLPQPKPSENLEACTTTTCGSFDEVDRLIPILNVVESMAHNIDVAGLLPSLYGYVIMWPVKATETFRQKIRLHDKESLLVLLCFYASVEKVFQVNSWWLRTRTELMVKAIATQLKGCDQIGERKKSICDYFNIS